MRTEQLVWEVVDSREGVSLLIDGVCKGRAYLEPLETKNSVTGNYYRAAMHYSLWCDTLKGKGWMTLMVDMLFDRWRWNPDKLIFVDDPDYYKWGGHGYHTDQGRRFAVAYRRKRGLKRKSRPHKYSRTPWAMATTFGPPEPCRCWTCADRKVKRAEPVVVNWPEIEANKHRQLEAA